MVDERDGCGVPDDNRDIACDEYGSTRRGAATTMDLRTRVLAALSRASCRADFRARDYVLTRRQRKIYQAACAEASGAQPVILVQDYHFALAPRRLRQRCCRTPPSSAFWHIPWPGPRQFAVCPWRADFWPGCSAVRCSASRPSRTAQLHACVDGPRLHDRRGESRGAITHEFGRTAVRRLSGLGGVAGSLDPRVTANRHPSQSRSSALGVPADVRQSAWASIDSITQRASPKSLRPSSGYWNVESICAAGSCSSRWPSPPGTSVRRIAMFGGRSMETASG